MKLFICCVICLLAANWVVEDTDSSERLIINVCRNISRVDADASCPSLAAVCLVSEYKLASTVFDFKKMTRYSRINPKADTYDCRVGFCTPFLLLSQH